MLYDDAVAAFFAPRPEGTPLPRVVRHPTPARRLRDAAEPVAMHPVWSRRTNEHLAGLGLDFLTSYVGGRAAVLGAVRPAVAACAFAWFEPTVVAAVVEAAWTVLPPAELLAAREQATVQSLREVLGDDDPTEVADLLADAAAAADGTGRPLFTGVRDRGRPDDPVHRLWWACELVREHRGDSHVAAANAAALGPVEMNVLTELWIGMPLLSYASTRVWGPDALEAAVASLRRRGWVADDVLTDAGRAARDAVEAATDAQEEAVVQALGERLDEVCGRLDGWGERCVTAGAFPADVLKRAAG
jgi:hypothetical protein